MPRRVTRRSFSETVVGASALVGSGAAAQPAATKRPNVLFILAALDGETLMPVLAGERPVYQRALFWRTFDRAAARVGDWKYLADKDGEYLFDLAVDPGEKADRRKKEGARFERIKQQYLAWNAGMLPRPKEPL